MIVNQVNHFSQQSKKVYFCNYFQRCAERETYKPTSTPSSPSNTVVQPSTTEEYLTLAPITATTTTTTTNHPSTTATKNYPSTTATTNHSLTTLSHTTAHSGSKTPLHTTMHSHPTTQIDTSSQSSNHPRNIPEEPSKATPGEPPTDRADNPWTNNDFFRALIAIVVVIIVLIVVVVVLCKLNHF